MKLNDIARSLNVSPASVSIVRRGKPGVGPAMRRRIQLALEENGYTYKDYAVPGTVLPVEPRHHVQRYIRLMKYYNSALLTDQNEGFVDDIIDTISAFTRSEGFDLVLNAVSHDKYEDFLNEMKRDNCAGLLVLATEMERCEICRLSALSVPIVILDSDHPGLPFPTVTMNNRDLAYEAVSHLTALGCDEVGYLRSNIRTGNFISRANGYAEALRDFGISRQDAYVFRLTPSLSGACADMLAHLASGRRVPRALFADNDVIAIGAMQAMKQQGISLPGRVYLVGVDNTMLSQVSSPTLSSIQISRSALGQKAVMLLLEQMTNPAFEIVHIHLGTHLIVRESST